QAALGFLTEKIGTAERADKDKISGEKSRGIVSAGKIGNEKRDVLRSVAGGVNGFDAQVSEGERGAVAKFVMGKGVLEVLGFVVGAEPELRAGAFGEFARAGSIIGVDVGFEDVSDFEAIGAGVVEVHVHVAAGIDNGAAAARGKHVGIVGEAGNFHAVNLHPRGSFRLPM